MDDTFFCAAMKGYTAFAEFCHKSTRTACATCYSSAPFTINYNSFAFLLKRSNMGGSQSFSFTAPTFATAAGGTSTYMTRNTGMTPIALTLTSLKALIICMSLLYSFQYSIHSLHKTRASDVGHKAILTYSPVAVYVTANQVIDAGICG